MKQIGEVILFFFLAILFAACTEETSKGGGEEPRPGGDGSEQRREVQLTLNNELVLKKITTRAAGDPIATVEENAIASLDVYVFGSAEEEGTYTFQERFAYRADEEAGLPAGATRLDLTPTDDTKKQTKGLLKLKKGLFVKLYCIANCTTLINPETTNPVKEKDFIPLTYSAPGETGTGVANEGSPHEDRFVTFHTPLLDADQADDILLTPLAMSGAYTIPLDLTDFETSARVQLNFKLTRLAARFDIVNKADESRFTIEEIAMGNGRRGSAFFPIRIYGQTPTANAGELITYPVRPFDGADANAGTQTGAFYSYPSPLNDNGFLILKGTYQVNQTEEKKVSYQIPFIQYAADGSSTAIEINNNHRYTIGITEADDYHLDFTLTVADWTDNGKIDDYTPGEDEKSTITVDIPDTDTETTYNEDTQTISMSIKNGTEVDLIITSTAPLSFKSIYAGGPAAQVYDWMNIEEKSTRTSLSEYKYLLTPKDGYREKRFPKAVLRFMNMIDGSESVVFVDALAAPSLDETPQPAGSFNSFSLIENKAVLYKTTGSNVKIQLSCPDGVKLKSYPSWLTAAGPEISGIESTYTFTLNDRETAETSGEIIFCNTKNESWTTPVSVELKDASITPEFKNVGGATNNDFTAESGSDPANVVMSIVDDNTFTINTMTLDGVAVSIEYEGDSPKWLTCAGASSPRASNTLNNLTKATLSPNELKFILNTTELAKAPAKKATVTLQNRSGGPDYKFTITPKFKAPSVELISGSNSPVQNSLSGSTIRVYRVANSKIQIKASALGGSEIQNSNGVSITGSGGYGADNTYTIVWNGAVTDNGSFELINKSDASVKTTFTVEHPSAEITAGNLFVTAANSGTTNLSVTSPEGCRASVSTWRGGEQWFTFQNTDIEGGSSAKTIGITQSGNTGKLMKPVTVKLTNKIAGGGDKVITITPTNFAKPSLSSTGGTLENIINESTSLYFNVTPTAGSYEYMGITDSNIASVSQSGNKFTVTAKHAGTTTINFRNKSATSQTASFKITVSIDYNGKAVYKYNNVYIAPEDIRSNSVSIQDQNICSSVSGGWMVPGPSITSIIFGVTYDATSGAGFQYLKNNNILSTGAMYWLASEGNVTQNYALYFNSSYSQVKGGVYSATPGRVRCMKR